MREHPYECIEVFEDGWSFLAKPNKQPTVRQDYSDNYYLIHGSSCFASIDFLYKHKSFVKENITQYNLLAQHWSIDFDEKDDLVVAEKIIKMNRR
jgi:CMP-N-acetylneuraminic acid synthetase